VPPKGTLLDMSTPFMNPVSTNVHSNVDNLIFQSNLDEQEKKEKMYGAIYEDKSPEFIGGMDDVVANVAFSPLIAAKKIPDLMKTIKKIGLKNPLYHFTSQPRAEAILKSGQINPSGSFPSAKPVGIVKPRGFSVTRDPKFASRPHKHVPTDVRFIMDRDDLIRKGYNIKPFTESHYRKTSESVIPIGKYKEIHGYYPYQMNPRFEFEERIAGSLPVSDIKLIDFLKFPKKALESEIPRLTTNRANLLHRILDRDIPIMMSKDARREMKALGGRELLTTREFDKLMSSPTYSFDPFKRRKFEWEPYQW